MSDDLGYIGTSPDPRPNAWYTVRGIPDVRTASPDNPVPLVGGVEVLDPRLGRVPFFDPRSRQFPMAAALEEKAYRPRGYTWDVPVHLDQGSQPSCVGHAWAHELIARPARVTRITPAFAHWLYKTCQKYDYWAGEAYEGTSVLAGAKVLHKLPPEMPEGRGLITEYRWIFADLDALVKTLGYFGPVVFGTWWYTGMFKVDTGGYIRPTGTRAGGHAYLVKGVDVQRGRFRIHNSWGERWGQGGDAWLAFDDALRLLSEDGECCVPMGRMVTESD